MNLGQLSGALLVFALSAGGIAWWPVSRLPFSPAERITAAAALSLTMVFLASWTIYLLALPLALLWILPAGGLASLALGWSRAAETWRDLDGRALIVGQLTVTAWCVGWLGTVASYSGGGWTSDWFEHWERTTFFLEHRPPGEKFLGLYLLPARPPLANLVNGSLLALTRIDFAHYQLFSTLLASLAFLPAALLARRFGRGRGAIALCAVAVMANPLFLQNATFAWTKLPAAGLTLTALYFFLRAQEPGAPVAMAALFSASLAAGFLTHYSVGPYAVMLAAGWCWLGWRRVDSAHWQRATLGAGLLALAVAGSWFAWSLRVYGARETFLSNTSVTAAAAHHGSQLVKVLGNFRDTLVPHFLRPLDRSLIEQQSPWGQWRDWFFQAYQLNLLLACGSVAWAAAIREVAVAYRRRRRETPPRWRWFWTGFIAGVVVLGIATHGARDEWGLAHICLQPLVLLAIAFLAGRWSELGRGWRIALLVGAAVDVVAGILLQFAVQSYALDRWLAPGRPAEIFLRSYTEAAFMNLAAKIKHKLAFFSDELAVPPAWLAAVLLVTLVLAVRRAARLSAR